MNISFKLSPVEKTWVIVIQVFIIIGLMLILLYTHRPIDVHFSKDQLIELKMLIMEAPNG